MLLTFARGKVERLYGRMQPARARPEDRIVRTRAQEEFSILEEAEAVHREERDRQQSGSRFQQPPGPLNYGGNLQCTLCSSTPRRQQPLPSFCLAETPHFAQVCLPWPHSGALPTGMQDALPK